MYLRVAPQAESDLDEIWNFLATQSSNVDVADRVIDSRHRDSERAAAVLRTTKGNTSVGEQSHEPSIRRSIDRT